MTVDDFKRLEKYHREMIRHHHQLEKHFREERLKLEQKQRTARAERTSESVTQGILEKLRR